jgi:hypothetical protein
MAHGVKTGGRKKGTPNKANALTAAEIAATGETPLEYMTRVMRDPTVDHDRRDKMAAAAAPYVHARLAAVEHSGDKDKPIVHTVTWQE